MRIGVREPAIRVLLGRLLRAGLAAADPKQAVRRNVNDLYLMIVR
ncbi:MAG: hypothetical protein ACREI9_01135 [Nitrospiraceae bacterium]